MGIRPRTHIVVHHSATPDGRAFDTQAIRRFHTSWRRGGDIISEATGRAAIAAGEKGIVPPWRAIGYHRLIERVGEGLEVIVGREDNESAAACPELNMNELAFHVCCIGSYDLAGPPDDLVKRLLGVLAAWRSVHGIPVENILGHTEIPGVAKTCPGLRFDMALVREMAR